MSIYNKLSSARQAEYRKRVERIQKKNPNITFPSDYHHQMLDMNLMGIDAMIGLKRVFPVMSVLCGCGITKKQYAGQALTHAAALGDLELCQRLLEDGAPVNMKNAEGYTALMNTVKRKRLRVAEYLLAHGAKIMSEKNGWNPVLDACSTGCIPALNMFKHYGVDFNKTYVYRKKSSKLRVSTRRVVSPLMVACAFKQPKAVQFLLDNGADIDQVSLGWTIRDMVLQSPEVFDEATRHILLKKIQETPRPKSKTCRSWPRQRLVLQR